MNKRLNCTFVLSVAHSKVYSVVLMFFCYLDKVGEKFSRLGKIAQTVPWDSGHFLSLHCYLGDWNKEMQTTMSSMKTTVLQFDIGNAMGNFMCN